MQLPDVTVGGVMTLQAGPSDATGEISGISIHVLGRIEGTAHIVAGNWEPRVLEGDVDLKLYHDWFSERCDLEYVPQDVKSGELSIYYTFH